VSVKSIAVIGAGPAGVAAAVQCKRLGGNPWLVDSQGEAGGLVANAFCVENYPGVGPTAGPDFAGLLREHLNRFDVPVNRGTVERVVSIDGEFELTGDFGSVRADAVIAATGTIARRIDIPDAHEAEGRHLFYEVHDFILSGSKNDLKDSQVAVIGGGEAALDYSLSLARAGAQVTVLVRGGCLKADGRLVEHVSASSSVEIVYKAVPIGISEEEDSIRADFDKAGTKISLSVCGVFVAIGRYPALGDVFAGLDVEPQGTVSTRTPGLLVIGDARSGSLGQVGMAVGGGLDAAMAAISWALRNEE
jgi:thioredoxin reductase (NADPH)